MNKPVESSGNADQPDAAKVEDPAICGIIMPIAEFGSRTAKHWASVLDIVKRAIVKSGLRPRPVWENEAVDIIHERIILNIFNDPIVVADVSCLNPNVMFEIGMRITLGKPIIMIGDKETVSSLPFDTKIIDHLTYDGALQFHDVEEFIGLLSEKIQAIKNIYDNNSYKPFIRKMGPVEIVAPSTESVPEIKAVMNKLNTLEMAIMKLRLAGASLGSSSVKARMKDNIKISYDIVDQRSNSGSFRILFDGDPLVDNDGFIKSILSLDGMDSVGLGWGERGRIFEIIPSPGRDIDNNDINYFKSCIASAEKRLGD